MPITGVPTSAVDPVAALTASLASLASYVSVLMPVKYGARGDAVTVADGAITSGQATLTCGTSTPFTTADVGKVVVVTAAGGAAISTPAAPTPVGSTSGGTLAAATYYYRVAAQSAYGLTLAGSAATVTTTGATSSVALTWAAVTGAVGYQVYRGTVAGSEQPCGGTTGTSWTDTGATTPYNTAVPTVDLSAAPLVTTISACTSSSRVTLTATASRTVTAASVDFGTDDTVALQALITAAQSSNRTAYLPTATYLITAPLVVSDSLRMVGDTVHETWEPINGHVNRSWFTVDSIGPGSIIRQVTAAADAIQITTAGKSVDLANFGVTFGSAVQFTNTGHGINATPPTASGQSYKDHGVFSGTWDSVKVFGHDGFHYGFKIVNPLGLRLSQLRAFGGGGLWLRNESTAFYYGNARIDGLYVALIAVGTADGIHIDGTGNAMQLSDWSRPQVWVANSGLAGATTPEGSSVNMALRGDATYSRRMTWNSPDFESNTSPQAQVQWPLESNKVNNKSSVLLPVSAGNAVLETAVGNISQSVWYRNMTGTDVIFYMGLRATPIAGTAATFDILLSKDGTNTIEQPISLLTPATAASPVLDLPVQVSFYLPAGWYYQIQSARFQWRQFRYHEVNGV